jgi:hypothetical protein
MLQPLATHVGEVSASRREGLILAADRPHGRDRFLTEASSRRLSRKRSVNRADGTMAAAPVLPWTGHSVAAAGKS